MKKRYNKISPGIVHGLIDEFLNTKDFADYDYEFEDIGVQRAWELAMRWVKVRERSTNQFTYQGIEIESEFTKEELIATSVYFYLVSSVRSVPYPSLRRQWRVQLLGTHRRNFDQRWLHPHSVPQWLHIRSWICRDGNVRTSTDWLWVVAPMWQQEMLSTYSLERRVPPHQYW